jgi:hypothetical protein
MTERKIRANLSVFDTEVSQFRGSLQEGETGVSEFSNGCKYFRIKGSSRCGRVAQLGEHLLCKQGVTGSIPVTSTNLFNGLRLALISSPARL